MKKLSLLLVAMLTLNGVAAQIVTPQPSPAAKVMQEVGLTDVTLEYSRPAMRGRVIFGDLVPYNQLWRTGANANSTVTFSTPVTINGTAIKAGTYAVFTKPGASTWDVILYKDASNWGLPQKWDDAQVAATATVTPKAVTASAESFTMGVNNVSQDGAHLTIGWDKTQVAVPFEVPTDATVSAAITKVMNGPSASDYYAAAVYYNTSGKDINQAKEWMEMAMALTEKPAFWQLRQQSLIYAKAGDTKKAIATAKRSLEGAIEAGNMDYVKMNKDSLKEWGA